MSSLSCNEQQKSTTQGRRTKCSPSVRQNSQEKHSEKGFKEQGTYLFPGLESWPDEVTGSEKELVESPLASERGRRAARSTNQELRADTSGCNLACAALQARLQDLNSIKIDAHLSSSRSYALCSEHVTLEQICLTEMMMIIHRKICCISPTYGMAPTKSPALEVFLSGSSRHFSNPRPCKELRNSARKTTAVSTRKATRKLASLKVEMNLKCTGAYVRKKTIVLNGFTSRFIQFTTVCSDFWKLQSLEWYRGYLSSHTQSPSNTSHWLPFSLKNPTFSLDADPPNLTHKTLCDSAENLNPLPTLLYPNRKKQNITETITNTNPRTPTDGSNSLKRLTFLNISKNATVSQSGLSDIFKNKGFLNLLY
nr:hypothetical protein Iba_chr13bCG2980 [Ipomoea batatas]